MYSKKFPKEIQGWIDIVEKNIYQCCEDQHLLVAYVKKCFETEDIFVDENSWRIICGWRNTCRSDCLSGRSLCLLCITVHTGEKTICRDGLTCFV